MILGGGGSWGKSISYCYILPQGTSNDSPASLFVMLIVINDLSLYPLIHYGRAHMHTFITACLEAYTEILRMIISVWFDYGKFYFFPFVHPYFLRNLYFLGSKKLKLFRDLTKLHEDISNIQFLILSYSFFFFFPLYSKESCSCRD